jgi:RND family efflux transporter MFP subunit
MTVLSRWRNWHLLGVGLLVAALAGCGNGHEKDKRTKHPEVVVTTPITDEVLDYQDFTGRLSAVKTVEIRARVTGYVAEAPFKEGDTVREDDLLFQIDPRPYQADLDLAEANLKLAEAERNVQERNERRDKKSLERRAISQEIYDQTLAALEKSRASVTATAAARDRAKLYLSYTRVTAPFSGRISRRYVDPGNLVNENNTVLTSLVAENPLWVYFDVDERTYLELVNSTATTSSSWFSGLRFPVLLRLANQEDFSFSGTVDFIDNQVSPTSGTIRMRAEFENPRGALKAGLFARVRLPIGNPYKTLLVPDEALMSDQGRKFVYVISRAKNSQGKEEDRVEYRVEYRKVRFGQAVPVVTKKKNAEGKLEEHVETLRVIHEGVAEGERVIVQGQQRVRLDTPVTVTTQAPPPHPELPLRKLLAQHRSGAASKSQPGTGGQ